MLRAKRRCFYLRRRKGMRWVACLPLAQATSSVSFERSAGIIVAVVLSS